MSARPWPRQRGAALILVLWMLALLALVAVAAAATARTETRLAANLIAEAEARHRAQAAAMHAALLLLGDDRPPVLETTVALPGGPPVAVTARDACGLVDLNTGLGSLVAAVFATDRTVPPDTAFARAQAVLDWRDPDSRRRVRGAEDADYALARAGHGARDGLFETVAELRQVAGIGEAAFARIRPLVTVDCLAAAIDPLAAPAALVRAIPGVPAQAAEGFLTRRAAWRADPDATAAPDLPGAGDYAEGAPAQAYHITARAGPAVWEAVVWLTGDPAQPLLLRRWRRAPPLAAEAIDSR